MKKKKWFIWEFEKYNARIIIIICHKGSIHHFKIAQWLNQMQKSLPSFLPSLFASLPLYPYYSILHFCTFYLNLTLSLILLQRYKRNEKKKKKQWHFSPVPVFLVRQSDTLRKEHQWIWKNNTNILYHKEK